MLCSKSRSKAVQWSYLLLMNNWNERNYSICKSGTKVCQILHLESPNWFKLLFKSQSQSHRRRQNFLQGGKNRGAEWHRFLSWKRRVLVHSGCYFLKLNWMETGLGHWVACTDWWVLVTFWSHLKLKCLFLKMMIHDRPYTTGLSWKIFM